VDVCVLEQLIFVWWFRYLLKTKDDRLAGEIELKSRYKPRMSIPPSEVKRVSDVVVCETA